MSKGQLQRADLNAAVHMSCLLQHVLADEQLYSSTATWLLARDGSCPVLGEWLRHRPTAVACPAGSEQLSHGQALQDTNAALTRIVAAVASLTTGSSEPQLGPRHNTAMDPRVQLDAAAVRLAKLHGHMLMNGCITSSSQHIVQLVKLVVRGPLQQHVGDDTSHTACGRLQLDQPSQDWLKQLATCPAAGATYAGRVLEGCKKLLVLQPQALKAALAASPHVQCYAPLAHRALQHPFTPTMPAAAAARPGHYGSLRGGGSSGWGAAGDGGGAGSSILAEVSPAHTSTPGSAPKRRTGREPQHDGHSNAAMLEGRLPMGLPGHSPGHQQPGPHHTPAPATPGTAGGRGTPGGVHTPGSGTPGSALSARAAFSGGLSPASFRSPTPTAGGAGVPSPFPAISMPQQGSRAAPAAKVDPRHAANQEKVRDLLYKLLKSVQLQLHHLQAPLEQLQATEPDARAVKEVLVPLAALLGETQRSMQDLLQQLLPSNLPHLADLILSCALQAASTGDAVLDPQLARVAAQDPARFSKLTERLQPSQQQQQPRQAGAAAGGAGGRAGGVGSSSKGAGTGARAGKSSSSSSRTRTGGGFAGGGAGSMDADGGRIAPAQQAPTAGQQQQQQQDSAASSGWAAICRPQDRKTPITTAAPGAAGAGAAAGSKGDRRAAPAPATRRQLQVVPMPSAPAGPFTGPEAGDATSSSSLAVSSCLTWLQAAPQAQHSLFVAVHASDSMALHQQLLGAVTKRLEVLLQGPQQALVSLGQQAQVARILGLWLAYLAVTPFASLVTTPGTTAAGAAAVGSANGKQVTPGTWDAASSRGDGDGGPPGPVLQLQHALDIGRLLSSSSGSAWSLLMVLPALAAYLEAVHKAAPCLLRCRAARHLAAVLWQLLRCSALSPVSAGYQPLSACIRAQLEVCWQLMEGAAASGAGAAGHRVDGHESSNFTAGAAAAETPGSSNGGDDPVMAQQLQLLEQGIAAAASWLDDPYWQLCMADSIGLVQEVVSMSAHTTTTTSSSGGSGTGSGRGGDLADVHYKDKPQQPTPRTPLQPQAQPRADAVTPQNSSGMGASKLDALAPGKAPQAPSTSSQRSSPSAASESASEASAGGATRRATATMLALRPAVQKEVSVPPALQAAVAVLRDSAKMQLQQAFLMQYSADEPIKLIDLVATVSGVLAQHALGAGLSQGVPPVLQERLEAVKQQARAALEAQPPPAATAPAAGGGAPVSEEEARTARAQRAHESMLAVGSCVQAACTSAGPEAVSQALEAAFAAATAHISANAAAALQALAPVGLPPPVLAAATAVVQDTSNAAVAQRLLQQVPPLVGSLLEQSGADLVRQICREQAMASRMTGPLAATGSRHSSSAALGAALGPAPAGGPQPGAPQPPAAAGAPSSIPAVAGAELQQAANLPSGLAQSSSGSVSDPAAATAAAAAAADGGKAAAGGPSTPASSQQAVRGGRLGAPAAPAVGSAQRVSKRITPVPMQPYPEPTGAEVGSDYSSSGHTGDAPVTGSGAAEQLSVLHECTTQQPAIVGAVAVAGSTGGSGGATQVQQAAAGGVPPGTASSLTYSSPPTAGAAGPGGNSCPSSSSSSSSSSRVQARNLACAVLSGDWQQVLLLLAASTAAEAVPPQAKDSTCRLGSAVLEQASYQQQQQQLVDLTQVVLDVSQQLVSAIESGEVPLRQVERTLLQLIATSTDRSTHGGSNVAVGSVTVPAQQQQQQQLVELDDATASGVGGISTLGAAVLLLCGAFVYRFHSSPSLLRRVWFDQEAFAGTPVQGLTALPAAVVANAKLASQHHLLHQLRKWLQQVTVLSGVAME